MIQARLYDADGNDQRVDPAALAGLRPGDHQLLWVDLQEPTRDEVARVGQAMVVPMHLLRDSTSRAPAVLTGRGYFRVDAVPVTCTQGLDFRGALLSIVAGENCVVTIHDAPVPFLSALREQADGDTDLGVLAADSFTASLLDWHLSTYFEASAELERHVERLEVALLDGKDTQCLDELRRLRRGASRLRRMLAPHRVVFGTLSRPDFRPDHGRAAQGHYAAIDTRFERAMDMVEHGRDLVIGSFELFSSHTALQTNRAMSKLTFVTVVLGMLAVISGMMGMNFDAAIYGTGNLGFFGTAGLMLAIATVSILLRRRGGQ